MAVLPGNWNGGDLQGQFDRAGHLLTTLRLVNGVPYATWDLALRGTVNLAGGWQGSGWPGKLGLAARRLDGVTLA